MKMLISWAFINFHGFCLVVGFVVVFFFFLTARMFQFHGKSKSKKKR